MLIARFYGIPVDPGQLRHQFLDSSGKFSEVEILTAAKQLDLKAGVHDSRWDRLPVTPLPALVRYKDGRYVVLARVDAERALIQDPLEAAPQTLPRDLFEGLWSGTLILFTKRAGIRPEDRRFDFTWFIPSIVKHRKVFKEALTASFFLQLFALLTPLFFQVVIDKVLVHKALTTLHVIAIGMLAIVFFEVLLGGLRTYVFSHTTSRIDVTLGAELFRHLVRLPLAYFESRRVGETVSRVRELEAIRQFLTGTTVTVVIDLLFTVIFIAVMFLYSAWLTLLVLAAIPCYVLLSVVLTPMFRARLNERSVRSAENQSFLVEAINGIETVKAMAVEPAMQRRWEEQLAGHARANFRAGTLTNIAGQGATFVSKLTTVAILWIGAHLVINGDISIGQLIAFNMLSGRVSGPLLRIAQMWQDFQQSGISMNRLGDLLNTPPEPAYNPSQATLPELRGHVVFDNVSFRYRPDGQEILKNLSFDIPAGSIVGFVGRSGSGKSTVAKLVQRLYLPQSGRVLVDDVDLAQVEPSWLRRRIGVVLQENFLFNRSVRDNIALADPGMPLERVIEAAKLAGAHEFILEMKNGYDSPVGEHGCMLSGGQRQRIAIARALVTDPRLLIFDEATSALDYESESIIQQNLERICQGRTVLIVAHRLSTVRHAHRIYVIEKGEIAEQGSHHELLKLKGYYWQLHQHQEGTYATV